MTTNISKTLLAIMLAALMVCVALPAQAKVTAEQAAKLNKDLTPVGAERAGNKEGTIPAWTGGLSKIPDNVKYDPSMGQQYPDPFADDKILFTITSKNVDQYKDRISPGLMELFKRYPDTWKMHVYPTRRTAAYSEELYKSTYDNALTAECVDRDGSIDNYYKGIVFPMATTGSEAILNFLFRPMGCKVLILYPCETTGGHVLPDGSIQKSTVRQTWFYLTEMVPKEQFNPKEFVTGSLFEMQTPPGRKGEMFLRLLRGDYREGDAGGWVYMPGQRRVRRAPNVFYDGVDPSMGGLSVNDDNFVYSSKIDRFDWTLSKTKKEMFIAYNTYKLDLGGSDAYSKILTPLHPNPELIRWELHRVYENVATLREGYRHVYSKRVFYQDEDSWVIFQKDQYDMRGQLWRMTFSSGKEFYDIPVFRLTQYFNFDFQVETYAGAGLIQGCPPEGHDDLSLSYWSVDNLRKLGMR